MWLATNVLVKPFPWFHPSTQLYCLNSNLPSLQQCLQHWEAAALQATRVTLSPCPAKILWPGPNEPILGKWWPHQPTPSSCLLAEEALRGLWGQHCPADQQGEPSVAALVPPDPQGRAAAHGDKDPVLPRAWSQSLCVGTPTEPQPCELIHCSHEFWNSLQQAKQELPTPQKWGSMEFIAQSTL